MSISWDDTIATWDSPTVSWNGSVAFFRATANAFVTSSCALVPRLVMRPTAAATIISTTTQVARFFIRPLLISSTVSGLSFPTVHLITGPTVPTLLPSLLSHMAISPRLFSEQFLLSNIQASSVFSPRLISLSAKGEVIFNGSVIGTAGSYTGNGNVIANLFDANDFTVWQGPDASGDWAGIDAGTATLITRLRISAAGGKEDLPIGALIQGSNDSSFTSWVTLATISSRLVTGTLLNEYELSPGGNYYRYYRFLSAPGNYGSIADLEFVGDYTPGVVAQAAPVTFSPFGGVYDLATLVTLSSLTLDAVIYYTTDGSTPTTSSLRYATPFAVSSDCTLNAVAVSPSVANSRMTAQIYSVDGSIISTTRLVDTNRGYPLWQVANKLTWDPVGLKWYWLGMNLDQRNCQNYFQVPSVVDGWIGFNIYSSVDLRNWKYETTFQTPSPGTADGVTNSVYNQRACMLYNAANNNYVTWLTLDPSVPLGIFVVLTSPTPTGPFTQVASYSNLDGVPTSGDFTLFLDPTDNVTAYIVRTCHLNVNVGVSRLSANYTNTDGVNKVYYTSGLTIPFGYAPEGHTMFKRGSTYFWQASAQTGWLPNNNQYCTAPSPLGPWSTPPTNAFQPVSGGTPNYLTAFDSQTAQIIAIPGRDDGSGLGAFIYIGDRYDEATYGDFRLYRTIMLPVAFPTATTMSITWNNAWSFDGKFPTVSGAPLAATGLVVNAGTATWINNATGPCAVYLDSATNIGFTQNVISQVLPSGSTSNNSISPTLYYRVRTVNASGTANSLVAYQLSPTLKGVVASSLMAKPRLICEMHFAAQILAATAQVGKGVTVFRPTLIALSQSGLVINEEEIYLAPVTPSWDDLVATWDSLIYAWNDLRYRENQLDAGIYSLCIITPRLILPLKGGGNKAALMTVILKDFLPLSYWMNLDDSVSST